MAERRNIKPVPLTSAHAAAHEPAHPGPADVLGGASALSVDGAVALLVALAPLRWASIWARDSAGVVRCVSDAGEAPSRPVGRQVARRLLEGEDEDQGHRRVLIGVALGGREQPLAALVGRAEAGEQERSLALMAEATTLLEGLLLRDIRDAERAAHEQAQLRASERRLTRAGLDLHDGPIQELAALAADTRLLANQLDMVLSDSPQKDLMHGRVEDLDAQIIALDHSLRQISSEMRAGQTVPRRRFRVALEDTIRTFAERTGIRPQFTLAGPVGTLSESQQIALLNIVAEALSNVRKHADAHTVEVVVRSSQEGAEATIGDDGRGFDPEDKRAPDALGAHTGLPAIRERVRLLGGACLIESRPGGPTAVRVLLPRWTPAGAPHEGPRRRHAVASSGGGNGASSFSTA
jgi:signal transduction histidine kinase